MVSSARDFDGVVGKINHIAAKNLTNQEFGLTPISSLDFAFPRVELKVGTLKQGVATETLPPEILKFIKSVTFEQSSEIADMITITCDNPDNMFLDLYDYFSEDTIVDVYMGYGKKSIGFIGRAVLLRWLPNFPEGKNAPSITLKGYSLENVFMRQKGPTNLDLGEGKTAAQLASTIVQKQTETRIFEDMLASEAVAKILTRSAYSNYNFHEAIHETDIKRTWTQPLNMSDWEFIRNLAQFHGFECGIESFKTYNAFYFTPETVYKTKPIGNLVYGAGPYSTLLSFKPEWGFETIPTSVEVIGIDKKTGEVVRSTISTELETDKDEPRIQRKRGNRSSSTKKKKDELDYGTNLVLQEFGDSFLTIPINDISPKEAGLYARSVLCSKLKNFFVGTGKILGHYEFSAGQVWRLHNISNKLFREDGYYVYSAKHTFDRGTGYTNTFKCRMLLPEEVRPEVKR